jgi:hypothetical protein
MQHKNDEDTTCGNRPDKHYNISSVLSQHFACMFIALSGVHMQHDTSLPQNAPSTVMLHSAI